MQLLLVGFVRFPAGHARIRPVAGSDPFNAFDLLRDTMEGMMRIGLTGGIAAGKSTVAQRLNDLGLVVIDYDALARQIVAPGSEGLRRIAQEFGEQAIGEDGGLNRSWLAGHVFGEQAAPGARERLDAIEHPLIYEAASRIEQRLMRGECETDGEVDGADVDSNHETGGHDSGTDGKCDDDENHERRGKYDGSRSRGGREAATRAIVVHDVPLLAEVIDAVPFSFAHIVSVEAPAETRIARMMGTRGMTREQALGRIRHQSSEAERRALADEVIDATQPIERMFEHVDTLVAQWRSELRDESYR
jgi:dephospho-CoA kinase